MSLAWDRLLFVEGLCMPVAQARFIWRDANAIETLQ